MAAVPFKARDRVQELAKPFRLGTVMLVRGLGDAALVTVAFDNWHPITLHASQLELL